MHGRAFPNQRWGSILPGLRWLSVQALTNRRAASGVGISTPCVAGSIQENIAFVHGVLELWRCGGIYDRGMGSYRLRVALALHAPAKQRPANEIGVSTSCGAVPRDSHFHPRGVGVCNDTERFTNRGWGPILRRLSSLYASTCPSQSAIDRRIGSSTPCGAVSTRENSIFVPRCRSCRCMPRGLGVEDKWKDVCTGEGALSSPGCPCVTRPSQSAIGPWDWGFHTVRGGGDPG